jgi:hypothetical protein
MHIRIEVRHLRGGITATRSLQKLICAVIPELEIQPGFFLPFFGAGRDVSPPFSSAFVPWGRGGGAALKRCGELWTNRKQEREEHIL